MNDADVERPAAELLPVRMLNEYAYCPRLFHLMHVEQRFTDNHFTVEGRTAHRRVDQLDHVLPDSDDEPHEPTSKQSRAKPGHEKGPSLFAPETVPADDADTDPPIISRSVPIGSDALGITAKLDLVSTDGIRAVPVETKRGRVPDNPERSWEPERVQLMAQGLLLREAGYAVDHGILYFAESRTRVTVPFTPQLELRTLELIDGAKRAMSLTVLPDPLEDSPKCRGCSLNAICLPDETLALRYRLGADSSIITASSDKPTDFASEVGRAFEIAEARSRAEEPIDPGDRANSHSPTDIEPRRLYPIRDDATPLYVQEHGARVGTSRGSITITKEGRTLATARLQDVSQLVLCGNIAVSAQAIQILAENAIPIAHLSMGHWFYAITIGHTIRNSFDRAAQFDFARDPARCLDIAKQLVIDKAQNQRTLLRRNVSPDAQLDRTIADLDDYTDRVRSCDSIDKLRGLEGTLAARYFSQFSKLLKPRDFDATWNFSARNRRPPTDPVNALLSFGYAMLAKELTIALMVEGLDPYWGFYHTPRHGRPALALDLMEPFRPAVVDSAVITAINTGMVAQSDFLMSSSACVLRDTSRKAFIRAYESRLDTLITHPVFNYKCSWRIVLRLQCRLLARWLRGDIPNYTSVTTR
jgi:CRISPR-associated protein Cas1